MGSIAGRMIVAVVAADSGTSSGDDRLRDCVGLATGSIDQGV